MKANPGQLMTNYAFSLFFSVDIPQEKSWEDITPVEFFAAIYDRLNDLYDNHELREAIGTPSDAFDYQEPEVDE